MSSGAGEPSEEELRAAWEEQLRRLTPADVIVQAVVSLISLGLVIAAWSMAQPKAKPGQPV